MLKEYLLERARIFLLLRFKRRTRFFLHFALLCGMKGGMSVTDALE
jgi:hypothetical protein